MLAIKKQYVVTADNKKKAVLIDIETFNRMEDIIEGYGLAKYMDEVEGEEILALEDAREYYARIRKEQDI